MIQQLSILRLAAKGLVREASNVDNYYAELKADGAVDNLARAIEDLREVLKELS